MKEREKWKKEGSVNWAGIGVKPVNPEDRMDTIIMKNVIDPLITKLTEQQEKMNQLLEANYQANLATANKPVSLPVGFSKTDTLHFTLPHDPNQELKEIAQK